jgi:hypothetical protein
MSSVFLYSFSFFKIIFKKSRNRCVERILFDSENFFIEFISDMMFITNQLRFIYLQKKESLYMLW